MLDIALKHCIYEVCIDTLFTSIRRNFHKAHRIKKGDRIGRILERDVLPAEFYDCIVTSVKGDYIDITYDKAMVYSHGRWHEDKGDIENKHKYYKKKFEGKEYYVWEPGSHRPDIKGFRNQWSHLDIYRIEIYD